MILQNKYKIMRHLWCLLPALAPVFPLYAAQLSESRAVHAEQWELARTDISITAIEALAQTQQLWSQDPAGQHIELQYPGGEEGELWVAEMINWFVALGIPSSRLLAVPGSGRADMIRLRVIQSGESFR